MKRKLSFLLVLITVFTTVFAFPISAAKKNTYTSTLDIESVRQNTSGDGYVWMNIEGTLELNNINIDTTDDIGLKIPKNAIITLKGKNYIKASKIAITCLTSATFQGDGSLTVVSDDVGIRCLSLSSEDNVRFRSEKITVNAGKTGVYSENATLIFSADNMEITAADYAVKGEKVKIFGGTLSASGSIYASETLTLNAANLTVSAPESALFSERKIDISGVKLSVGESLSALADAEGYGGEKSIKAISTVKTKKNGVLFGGKLPAFVDYIVFVLILLAVLAVVIVPIYIKHRKTQKIKASGKK